MKTFRTEERLYTYKVDEKFFCDFCGKEFNAHPKGGIEDVTLSYEFSDNNWPEGGDVTTSSYDCCGECWDHKIAPALAALAVTPITVKKVEF